MLRVSHTSVRQLPSGLLRFLSNRLSILDIRGNRLVTLSPDVLQLQVAPEKRGSDVGSGSRGAVDSNHWHSFSSKCRWTGKE